MLKSPTVVIASLLLLPISFPSIAHSDGGPSIANASLRVFALGQPQPSAADNLRVLPRHYPNPQLLKLLKQSMAAGKSIGPAKRGGGGGGRTSNPAPQTSPTTQMNFSHSLAGLGFLDSGYYPPDTNITAGTDGIAPTLLFEAVNLVGQFYLPDGASGGAPLDLTGCTPNPLADSVSDPRVVYDSGRWFISLVTFAPVSDAGWDLIMSTTTNPNSSTNQWLCLHVPTGAIRNPDGTTGNFPDFPKMGVSGDKIVLTGDAFSTIQHLFSTSYKFEGTEFVVLSKADLLNATAGSNVGSTTFNPPQGDFAIEPAQQLPAFPPPTTSPVVLPPSTLYMASVNSALSSTSTLNIRVVTGVPGGAPVAVTRNALAIHTIATPPGARQAGTSTLVDTNDDSLLDAVYRPSSGDLWVSANDGCTPTGDNAVRSCARFTEIYIPTMSVAQDFDLATPGNYYYYPAVSTNSAGDLVAAFTGSSSSAIPSAFGARRAASDASNTLSSISLINAGDTPYTVSPARWGDYSGAGVDLDDSTIWIAGEYATSCGFFGPCWGTSLASVP